MLDIDSEGHVEVSNLDSSKLVQTEEHDFDTTVTSSTEVPALPGHLYKGKRYNVGATADDGTTLTSTQRKVSDYIALSLTGTTYLPAVWEAGGANYTEMCLYAAVDGDEPANDAQALIYTKACGSMSQQTSGVVKPLTLIADTSVATYTFDTVNQIIRFNPEYVQYIRTYVTDDSTIARAEYTESTTETLECVDITNGVVKSYEPVTVTHEINGWLGTVYYKNGSDNSEGWAAFKYTGSSNVTTGSSNNSMTRYPDSGLTISKPVRYWTNPIELKYGGLSLDGSIWDYNGIGYYMVAFLDDDWNVIDGTEGINSTGTLSILSNQIIRDENATEMTVVQGSASGSGGTVDSIVITVPTSYKYVVMCPAITVTGTQDTAAEIYTNYTYIDEPQPEPEETVTKLSDYIDSKIPTIINDKYTWSRMYGANVCLFGGSFATATYGSKAHEYWEEKLGINLTNYAVGGAGIIQNVGTTPMQTQVANMVAAGKKYDLYIIWFSTNDQRKVGEVWTSGSSQTIQGNTYAGQDFDAEVIGAVDDSNRTSQSGGINWVMNQLYTFDPNAKIIMFTSMRHFASTYGYNDLDETGPSVRHFVEAQIRSCEYWGVPYVDQYRVWGVNTLNKTTFVRSDNLHPTDAGYLKIAALQTELMANM